MYDYWLEGRDDATVFDPVIVGASTLGKLDNSDRL